MAIIKIPDGNAFKLRVTAMVNKSPADLNVVNNIIVNFVRRGRLAQPHGLDTSGRLVISNDGSLARGIYGVEITGYHDGKPWRHYIKDALKIVDENEDADAPSVVDDVPVYDLSDNMSFGGDGVTAEYVNAAISAHDGDENAHPELQQMITEAVEDLREEIEEGLVEAGKVNDVTVNGDTVLDPDTKVANITVPTKISDLPNDSNYQTESQVNAKVAAAAVNEVNVSVDNTAPAGQPSAEKTFQDGVLGITFKNVKGEKGDKLQFSDLTAEEKASLKGAQGASAVFDPQTGNILATLEPGIGSNDANAMTQKAVTEELLVDKRTISLSGATVGRYINSVNKWVSAASNDAMRIAVTPNTIYTIKGNDTYEGAYAFLSSTDTANNNSIAQFADDYNSVVTIGIGADLVVVAPSNAAYLYFRTLNSGNDIKPISVKEVGKVKDEIGGLVENVSEIKADITEKNVILTPVRTSGYGNKNLYINGSAWKYNTNYSTTIIAVEPGKAYWVLPHASRPFYYAILTSVQDYANEGQIHFYDDTAKTYTIAAGKLTRIEIPQGACAIVYYSKSNGADCTLQAFYKESFLKDVANSQENFIETLSESIEEQGFAAVETKTITSLVEDTYVGGYLSSAGHNFKNATLAGNKTLIYFPEYYVVGGESITIRYTGIHAITVFAMPFAKLGTSYVDAYDTTQITIMKTLPANTSESYTGVETLTLPSNCRRVALTVSDTVETFPNNIALEITSIDLPVMSAAKLTIPDSVDAVEKARVKELASQARYVNVSSAVQTSSLGLLHFTDIHGSQGAADAILEYAELLKGYINDILCTGDCPVAKADDTVSEHGATWWVQDSGLADKSLFVIGNHDLATQSPTEYDSYDEGLYFDGKGQEWGYNKYFAPFIENLGYVMPEGHATSHACYWHKDYASQKIRLIGLDCMHRFDGTLNPETGEIITNGVKSSDNSQELWLIEKLNETLNSNNAAYGYSVIICCHYPLDDFSGNNEEWNETTHKFAYNQKSTGGRVMSFKTGDCANFHYGQGLSFAALKSFNLRNRVANAQSTYGYDKGSVNNFGEIIMTWKGNGGKFVAWLSGHNHKDYFYYPAKYPELLVIDCDQAGYLRPIDSGRRVEGTPSGVCANFLSVDTQNGLVKIVRIGYTTDKLLNSHEQICYDYVNKKVLNEK